MKVLLFSTGFYEYMISLANAMGNNKDVILVMPNNRMSPKHISLIDPKITFEPFELIDYKSIRQNWRMIHNIVRIVKKHDPDVIHIQSNGHRWFWLAYPFLRKYKFVNTVHDPALHAGDKQSKEATRAKIAARKRCRAFLVHGKTLKKELMHHYRLPESKVHIVAHGDLAIYKNWSTKEVEPKPNNFLFFGRIWPYKGLEYFIKAANILGSKFPEATFTIAGTGEDIGRYQAMIERKEQFSILNYRISEAEIDALFQEAHAVVLPYVEATQSGVIPLSYAYNKPVISTAVGALPEVVVDGQTGFLVNPKSAEEIAEKMEFLLSDSDQYHTLQLGVANFVSEHLSWNKIALDTVAVYKAILD